MLKVIMRFIAGSQLAAAFLKNEDEDIINSRIANATSPDALIAYHFIEAFSCDFTGWRQQNPYDSDFTFPAGRNSIIHNAEKQLFLSYHINSKSHLHSFAVKNEALWIDFDCEMGTLVVNKFYEIRAAVEKAERVAALAKKNMEMNEKKWNLAEKLLGMKRNAHGALEPAVKLSQ